MTNINIDDLFHPWGGVEVQGGAQGGYTVSVNENTLHQSLVYVGGLVSIAQTSDSGMIAVSLSLMCEAEHEVPLQIYIEATDGKTWDYNFDLRSIQFQKAVDKTFILSVPINQEFHVGVRLSAGAPKIFIRVTTAHLTALDSLIFQSFARPSELQLLYNQQLAGEAWWPEEFHIQLHDVFAVIAAFALSAGGAVLDLGCNRGVHSKAALGWLRDKGLAGRIVAVDANPHMGALLQSDLGPEGSVQFLNRAIVDNDEVRQVPFFISDKYVELGSIVEDYIYDNFPHIKDADVRRVDVQCATIDRIIEESSLHADLKIMKVDLEGVDTEAIIASQSWKNIRPIIYYEKSSRFNDINSLKLFDTFESEGYITYDVFLNRLSSGSIMIPEVSPIDRIAVPIELANSFVETVRPSINRLFARTEDKGPA